MARCRYVVLQSGSQSGAEVSPIWMCGSERILRAKVGFDTGQNELWRLVGASRSWNLTPASVLSRNPEICSLVNHLFNSALTTGTGLYAADRDPLSWGRSPAISSRRVSKRSSLRASVPNHYPARSDGKHRNGARNWDAGFDSSQHELGDIRNGQLQALIDRAPSEIEKLAVSTQRTARRVDVGKEKPGMEADWAVGRRDRSHDVIETAKRRFETARVQPP